MDNQNQLSLDTRIPKNTIPNPIMLSRQIEGLREVMRRMQLVHSDSIEPLISEKLKQFAQS